MEYIDFTDDNQLCYDCNIELKSKIGIFSNGIWLGKKCAEKRGIHKKNLPNFTKGILVERSTTSQIPTKDSSSQNSIQHQYNRQECLSYLILRMKKLSDIKYMKHESLFELNKKYEENTLSDEDYFHISNIIKSVRTSNLFVSEKNVYFCYAVKVLLLKLIKKYPEKNFYKDILHYLQKNATISKKQFDCIKNDDIKIKYYSPRTMSST